MEGADIMVTTTPSRKLTAMNDKVSARMHVNCIGADAIGKEEVDSNILREQK